MVEYTLELDNVFGALADPTRRDILRRVSTNQLSISQIAEPYNLGFAAVSKHLMILERAKLVIKHKVGRRRYVRAYSAGLKDAAKYLEWYQQFTNAKFDSLDNYLNKEV